MPTQVCVKSPVGQCAYTGVVRIKSVTMIEKMWSFNHITVLSMQFSLKCFMMICIHSGRIKKAPTSIPKMGA